MKDDAEAEISKLRAELEAEDPQQLEEWLSGDEPSLGKILPGNELDGEMALKRYLLGALGREEKRRVENQLVDDEEFFVRMRIIEEELIDDYVSGALSRDEAEKFEKHFLSTAERKRALQLSAAMKASHAEKRSPVTESPGPVAESPAWLRRALVFTGFFNPATVRRSPTHIWSLALVPGQVRSEGSAASLNLPADVEELRLALVVENEDHRHYRAALRTVESKEIDTQQELGVQRFGDGQAVVMSLNPYALAENDYLITLEAYADGRYEPIATYFFRIISAK